MGCSLIHAAASRTALPDDLTDPGTLERHVAVNLFGTYAVTQAFLPAVTRFQQLLVGVPL